MVSDALTRVEPTTGIRMYVGLYEEVITSTLLFSFTVICSRSKVRKNPKVKGITVIPGKVKVICILNVTGEFGS